jgi:3-carboxy-cis,cis-muconate cycloisomerase
MSELASSAPLLGPIFAAGAVGAASTDHALLQAMLDTEAALARACAQRELIPGVAAEQIAAACVAEHFDIAAIGAE